MTTLPRPPEAYTWVFLPSATPLQFCWRTNFGLQGEAGFWETSGWVAVTSPCCYAIVDANTPGPGLRTPGWTCKTCGVEWLVMADLWLVEAMSPFYYLHSGGGDLSLGELLPWLVNLTESMGADPLTSMVVASRFREALQALSTAYLRVAEAHAELVEEALQDLLPPGTSEKEKPGYERAAERQVWHAVRDEMEELCTVVNLYHR